MNQPIPVMAHLVLGYPTLDGSFRTAETYLAAGCAILELQIPFSHPTADGPVITAACREAVAQGVTVADCLAAIRELREKYPEQEIMVMSYLNRIYFYGMDRFVRDLAEMRVRHIIVPDWPVETPAPPLEGETPPPTPPLQGRGEVEGAASPLPFRGGVGGGVSPFRGGLSRRGISLVPVIAANISDQRLDQLIAAGYDFFYLMSDFKITGSSFSLHPRLREITARIKSADNTRRVGIGFGINTSEQVRMVLGVADYAIIGSALIRAQQENYLENYLENLALLTTAFT